MWSDPIFKYLLIIVFIVSFTVISPKSACADSSLIRTEKKHFKALNKLRKSEKKGKRFVLVQTAKSASLEADPNRPNAYRLVLNEINPYIQFYKAQPTKSYGIIFMRQYVWFCKLGKRAFMKCKRGALGHVSYVSSSLNDSSNPKVFELISPKYIKKENKLIYEISTVDSFKIKENQMENVTLVIDLALN